MIGHQTKEMAEHRTKQLKEDQTKEIAKLCKRIEKLTMCTLVMYNNAERRIKFVKKVNKHSEQLFKKYEELYNNIKDGQTKEVAEHQTKEMTEQQTQEMIEEMKAINEKINKKRLYIETIYDIYMSSDLLAKYMEKLYKKHEDEEREDEESEDE